MPKKQNEITAVLVHAAWGDGSSWQLVTSQLQARGFHVIAAQLPLSSFSADVAALRAVLDRQQGPVVLVGHSYGGAVASAAGAGDPHVKALVYVAAIVPDEGETVGEIFARAAPHPLAPKLAPDNNGLLWVKEEDFRDAIAPAATPAQTALLAAAQKPIGVACLGEKMPKPAWREKPSWFLIAEQDRMVSPDTQRFLAERMHSQIVSCVCDHWPLASEPATIAQLVERAAVA